MANSKLYVPVSSRVFTLHKEEYLERFRLLNDPHIVIYVDRTFIEEKNARNLTDLKSNLRFLAENGCPSTVWIQSFGFGIPLKGEEAKAAERFTRITGLDGRRGMDAMCPTCNEYMRYYTNLIKGVAEAGAKRILLDDDLCLNIRPGLGCACENHMRLLEEKLGKSITREELSARLFSGESSSLRRIWMDLMGETLKKFCRDVRKEADEINPDIEMGFCAGYTSWDFEGVNAAELTKILAGRHKPFLRLTGAPYWLEQNRFPGQKSAQIVEFTRMQRAWCEKEDIEIFTENDSYPRPRYRVPAAILETFDFLMSADSGVSQLKYIFDYYSKPGYEEGYLNAHLRSAPLTKKAADVIGPMKNVGVCVWEEMEKVRMMTFPEKAMGAFETLQTAFSASASMLSSCGIPTVYNEPAPVTAAFGDSGRTVPLDRKAYIIDYPAALELNKRGIDTGILSAEKVLVPFTEFFIRESDPVLLDGCARPTAVSEKDVFFRCALKPEAEVLSVFRSEYGEFPAACTYENKDGMKFLIYLFDGASVKASSALSCSYYRQAQLIRFCESAGYTLPAVCRKNPEFYMIVKKECDTLAVSYCNFSMDPVYSPVIELSEKYAKIETIGAGGTLSGKKVHLSEIAPHAFGAVILRK